ncbi:hypothetical protein OV090_16560 [Nannocystis sp. RBIL2]|uniref:hypothetical protein n=1 Tax=Nannocystis sp. RBIL2 TaxID=2996788 RepID=UPI0022711AFA|nr:hypothetical protein [Nannocystis sp. RBIL2]MCY1066394.1 hypothetical protein [Nannocystis sp. RBIL2]
MRPFVATVALVIACGPGKSDESAGTSSTSSTSGTASSAPTIADETATTGVTARSLCRSA